MDSVYISGLFMVCMGCNMADQRNVGVHHTKYNLYERRWRKFSSKFCAWFTFARQLYICSALLRDITFIENPSISGIPQIGTVHILCYFRSTSKISGRAGISDK